MDNVVIFYVLYALSCMPCKHEVPQVYQTKAECEIALARWTQQSELARFPIFGSFKPGHSNNGTCRSEKLTPRDIEIYGGIKTVEPVR